MAVEMGKITSYYREEGTKPISVANARKTTIKRLANPVNAGGKAKDVVLGAVARGGKVVAELQGIRIAVYHNTANLDAMEPIHTNTMEGFWLSRAWYGSHHHYSTAYTPLYLAEACYKYNYRDENIFAKLIGGCFQ